MLNMNRATLLGRAGRDPKVRALKQGGKAAVFSLATSEKWTDRDGRPAEATEWHRVVVYGPAVEAVGKMLRKGDPVLVEGRIATRTFRDKDGTDRTITEIVVAGWQGTVNILGGRRQDRPEETGNEDPGSEGADGGESEPESPEDGGIDQEPEAGAAA